MCVCVYVCVYMFVYLCVFWWEEFILQTNFPYTIIIKLFMCVPGLIKNS